jgi:hypothetical protein
MDEDTTEKTKARRDLRIIIVCVAVGVSLPLVLFCFMSLGFFR